jgi:Recombination endonuclease VII
MESVSKKKSTKAKKPCNKCKAIQPLTNFYKCKRCKNGYRPDCKLCYTVNYRGRYTEYQKKWIKANPHYPKNWEKANKIKRKAINMKWTYNVTPVDFLGMLYSQSFSCADCKTPFGNDRKTRPNIDHAHDAPCRCSGYRSCGQCVRGLVCSKCNGERAKKDRIARLKVAA